MFTDSYSHPGNHSLLLLGDQLETPTDPEWTFLSSHPHIADTYTRHHIQLKSEHEHEQPSLN